MMRKKVHFNICFWSKRRRKQPWLETYIYIFAKMLNNYYYFKCVCLGRTLLGGRSPSYVKRNRKRHRLRGRLRRSWKRRRRWRRLAVDGREFGQLQQLVSWPTQQQGHYNRGTRELSTGDTQLSTGDTQLSAGDTQLSTGDIQLSTGDTQQSTSDIQLSAGDTQLSTYKWYSAVYRWYSAI